MTVHFHGPSEISRASPTENYGGSQGVQFSYGRSWPSLEMDTEVLERDDPLLSKDLLVDNM